MTKSELDALCALESRQDILICPANKGGAVVVTSLKQYDCGVLNLLNNLKHHKPLVSNPTYN